MEKNFELFLTQLYEAVEHPDLFERALTTASDMLGTSGVHLYTYDAAKPEERLNYVARIDTAFELEYTTDYFPHDYRIERVHNSPYGQVITDAEMTTEHGLKTNPVHQLLPRYEVYDLMGTNLTKGDNFGWFGVSSLRAGDGFTPLQRKVFERMIPHASRALHYRQRVKSLEMKLSLQDRVAAELPFGLIIFSQHTISSINPEALEILEHGFLKLKKAGLACTDREHNRKLAEAHVSALHGGLPLLKLTDERSGITYLIQMFNPKPQAAGGAVEAAQYLAVKIMMTGASEQAERAVLENMADVFRLSKAETNVICAVLSNQSLQAYSTSRSVRLDTVRKQLRSALYKMNINSQKQLFQLYEVFRSFSR
ncbi:helix-turn-helix transcriptional regulator [Pseudovibrio ascidiaceicola]|uniref:helix-turn-helix transcriptional regulator n=1 Tax=Pseudovibrio ascidiaceicola TaxID=285279 RepID=UPI003D3678CF